MTARHPFSHRRGRKVRQAQLRREPRCEMCLSMGVVARAAFVTAIYRRIPEMERDGGRA
jgi:hypothetical protein